jgi:phosphotransferase system HPr (HPr) family protein
MSSRSLSKIITEKEFLLLVQQVSTNFFKNLIYLKKEPAGLTKTYYSNLSNEARHFEDFLDNHGARENRTWVFFAELVASIRNFAIAGFQLQHVLDRYEAYVLGDSKKDAEKFLRKADEAIAYINDSVTALFAMIQDEARKNSLTITKSHYKKEDFGEIHILKRLPRNLDGEDIGDEERIIALARRFRNVAKLSKEINLEGFYEKENIRVIPKIIDETKIQYLKNKLHDIQSDYDTHIKNTSLEKSDKDLKRLRGFASLPLHILEMVRWLSHFFERHADEIRQGQTKDEITRTIDKEKGLDIIVNFAYHYSNDYLQKGKAVAERILTKYTRKVRYVLPIPKPLGFHARPAGYISLIVNEHGTDVFLVVDEKKFNAKSVLSLMEGGGLIADRGYKEAVFEGDKRVLDDIKILAEHNYCEDCEIPRELNYVRILRNK